MLGSPPYSTYRGPNTHNHTTMEHFTNLCNLIRQFRNNIHTISSNTWGTPGFPGTVNETLASVVTGLLGHGQQGQAQGNLQPGQLHRGDYLDPVSGDVSAIDCKADDRAFPGMDYIMQGQIYRLDGVQYIRILWDEMDSNTVRQLQMPRIRAAFQGEAASVQQINLNEEGVFLPVDNTGVTSGGAKWIEIENEGVRIWEGNTRDAIPPHFGEVIPWTGSRFLPGNLINSLVRDLGLLNSEYQLSVGDLESLILGDPTVNVCEHGYHRITGTGVINQILEVTTYTATPSGVRKIEECGGTVRTLGLLQLLIDTGNDPRLPTGSYIRMNQEIDIDDGEIFNFRIMQEDQHPHFEVSTATFEHMLEVGIPFVSHFRDRLARYCIGVLLIRPDAIRRAEIMDRICREQAEKVAKQQARGENNWNDLGEDARISRVAQLQNNLILNRADWFPERSLWVNLRLFPGCVRDCYYDADNTWSIQNFGAHLLALSVEQPNGMETIHWSPQATPENNIQTESISHILTGINNDLLPMPIYPTPLVEVDYEDMQSRRNGAEWFFESCVLDFYRRMNNWADITNTSRNIGFDDIGEHIALMWFGLRGSRVGTGSDAYNINPTIVNAPTSEIKTCVGRRGDYMGTRHQTGVFHLGMNAEELQQHERIIFVRIIDRVRDDGGNLSIAILASNRDTMADLHSHIVTYCNRMPASNEFEFMARPFEENYAQLSVNERLHFERLVEFVEYPVDGVSRMNILGEIPGIGDCACTVCTLGGARWNPQRPASRNSGEVRTWRGIRRLVDANGNQIIP